MGRIGEKIAACEAESSLAILVPFIYLRPPGDDPLPSSAETPVNLFHPFKELSVFLLLRLP